MGRKHIEIPDNARDVELVSDEYMIRSGQIRGSNRRLSVCRMLGQIYIKTDDEDVKLKLRYAATLSRYHIYKLRTLDDEWISKFNPRYKDYDEMVNK